MLGLEHTYWGDENKIGAILEVHPHVPLSLHSAFYSISTNPLLVLMENLSTKYYQVKTIGNTLFKGSRCYADKRQVIKEVTRGEIVESLTKEMCMSGLKEDGSYLKFVPDAFIDAAMCLEAVKNNPNSIDDVPPKFMSQELCRVAVKLQGYLITHIPLEFVDEDMYRDTMALRPRHHMGDVGEKFANK